MSVGIFDFGLDFELYLKTSKSQLSNPLSDAMSHIYVQHEKTFPLLHKFRSMFRGNYKNMKNDRTIDFLNHQFKKFNI